MYAGAHTNTTQGYWKNIIGSVGGDKKLRNLYMTYESEETLSTGR